MQDEIAKLAYKKANQMEDGGNITFADFSIDELKCLLITLDGMGKEFKERTLGELLKRAKDTIILILLLSGINLYATETNTFNWGFANADVHNSSNYIAKYYCSVCTNELDVKSEGYYSPKYHVTPCTNCIKAVKSVVPSNTYYELELLESGTTNKIKVQVPIVTNNTIEVKDIPCGVGINADKLMDKMFSPEMIMSALTIWAIQDMRKEKRMESNCRED